MNTGERLRGLRMNMKLTQAQFGELLGTDGNTVSRWERGVLDIGKKRMRNIAAAISTTVAYLIGETDDPSPPGERAQISPVGSNVYLANAIGRDSSVIRNVNGTLTVNEQGEVRDSIVFEQGEGEKKIRLVFPYGTSGDIIAQVVSAMLK
jgi:transcriptional regulator with XRE-family HTH domain